MQDFAETVALEALAWLVGDDDLLPVFLGATGASAEDLRSRASETDFLASVLDFILLDDGWVMRFCESAGLPGEAVLRARAGLPGGADPHWT
ncbi:DUF3572 domain-containing protein [Rhodovulum kholense]|uniref:Uncharacterized protein DUF3572 n=1 Tax=Rhodovulum kholense TaxID=453584 RepID=A0A8E2VNN3_9RHOB|nr:DUF3572 domain-containing protein [Rhodovulum kholense]PTW50981.1 uncharacterized protein DUF3572 [Rhodovulum kholense]